MEKLLHNFVKTGIDLNESQMNSSGDDLVGDLNPHDDTFLQMKALTDIHRKEESPS